MTQGICKPLWLIIMLIGLKIKIKDPMILYYDNKIAINIAHNPIYYDCTKNVEIDWHFIIS